MRVIKKSLISGGLILVLITMLSGFTLAQSNQAIANKSWNTFWNKFSTAVKNKDRKNFIALTRKGFMDAGGSTIEEWIDNTLWREIRKSVDEGTKDYSHGREIMRITSNRDLIFVYDKKKGWRFFGGLVA
jgi:hypothetical protein